MKSPRVLIQEVLAESRLTGRLFVIVEGPTDKRFLSQWLQQTAPEFSQILTVMTSQGVQVEWEQLAEIGLSEGAKQRVVWISLQIPTGSVGVACVADLDCGLLSDRFDAEQLWWTDYPALESYGFEPNTIDTLNRMFLSEQLPAGESVVGLVLPMLRDLYRIRLHNEDIEDPLVEKGFGKSGWEPERTVPPHIAARLQEFEVGETNDPRKVAYGHDIARVLLGNFAAEIKNRAKIADPSILETSLRASILLSGAFTQSALAHRMLEWLKDAHDLAAPERIAVRPSPDI